MHKTSFNEMRNILTRFDGNKDLNVLDVGSRDINGSYRPLIAATWNYTGIDLQSGPNVDVLMTNPDIIPFPDSQFDVILCGQCLEHVRSPISLLREIYRTLKPKGWILAVAPAKCHLHSFPYDYWRFMPEGMKVILEDAGFKSPQVYAKPDGIIDDAEKFHSHRSVIDCWGIAQK